MLNPIFRAKLNFQFKKCENEKKTPGYFEEKL